MSLWHSASDTFAPAETGTARFLQGFSSSLHQSPTISPPLWFTGILQPLSSSGSPTCADLWDACVRNGTGFKHIRACISKLPCCSFQMSLTEGKIKNKSMRRCFSEKLESSLIPVFGLDILEEWACTHLLPVLKSWQKCKNELTCNSHPVHGRRLQRVEG